MLTGNQIIKSVHKGDIIISPFTEDNVNPNSYNLTIGNILYTYDPDDGVLDSKYPERNGKSEIIIPEDGLVLSPNNIYLTKTVEQIGSDFYTFLIATRSSMGRLGMSAVLGNFGDVGYHGNITLQLKCSVPLRIYPYSKLAQIYFESLEGDITLYNGRYMNNDALSKGV